MFNRLNAVLVSLSLLLAACSTSSLPETPAEGSGAFKVLATATTPTGLRSLAAGDYKAVNLAVSGVVFVSGEETTDLATYSDPVEIDLMRLDSVQAELADATLPASTYEGAQLRLIVSSASLVVETEDGTDTVVELETPSAEQSGFKINLNNFEVDPVYGASVVLDFDAEKSIVATGNGKYLLKPVVKAKTEANARVKIVNAVADSPAAGLPVSANGLALMDVAYGAATPYLLVPAGSGRLSVTTAAQTEVDFENALTLTPQTDYTVVATGLLGAGVEELFPLTALVYTDDASLPATGNAKVRVVHAATGLGTVPLDVYAADNATVPDTELGELLAEGLEYGAAATSEVPAGTYRFHAAAAGGADLLVETNGDDPSLLEGKAYTVVALGHPALESELSLLITDAD